MYIHVITLQSEMHPIQNDALQLFTQYVDRSMTSLKHAITLYGFIRRFIQR